MTFTTLSSQECFDRLSGTIQSLPLDLQSTILTKYRLNETEKKDFLQKYFFFELKYKATVIFIKQVKYLLPFFNLQLYHIDKRFDILKAFGILWSISGFSLGALIDGWFHLVISLKSHVILVFPRHESYLGQFYSTLLLNLIRSFTILSGFEMQRKPRNHSSVLKNVEKWPIIVC